MVDGESSAPRRSFCRMCPALCGVTVTFDGDGSASVSGDRDHLLSRGYVCPKGRKMAAMIDDPIRLDRPLLRDGSGRLVPVAWDTALGDLAERLTEIRARHGDYAVGTYAGTMLDSGGRFYMDKLLREIGSPSRYTSATVDSIAKVLVGKLMSGREGLVPSVDFEHTTLLLVVGENLVVSHGGFSYFPDPVRSLRSIERRGEVWVLDPRRTETARLATRHLTPRGSTDFAVLAHLVREVLRDGGDPEYLAAHARNVDELRQHVERFDLATTAAMTGLKADDLVSLREAVRRHRRLAIITGTGVTMAATANVTEWMAFALQIVTGSFERPGGRWFNHSATFDPDRPAPDSSSFGAGSRTHPEIERFANQFPCAVMPAEIEDGHLKALLIVGGNPMIAFPQPDRLGRALDRLDVLASWDVVPSATAQRATHVFPCPGPLERADVVTPVHLSAVFAQYVRPAVPPPADRRPMWWSIAVVAQRMGIDLLPGGIDPDECTDEIALEALVAGTAVDWDALVAAGGRAVPYPRHDRWVERFVLPDGRWDVAPPKLVERLDHAVHRPAHDLVLGNRREVHHTNSTLAWEVGGAPAPVAYAYVSPGDADDAGIVEGQAVVVTSPFGSLEAEARIDESMARGTLVVPHGFTDPNVGHLTATDVDVDPLTGMPTLVGIPVAVRPVGA
ncbi:MAG: molybdopterin-dependent oxidoreductase [Acidimicrobiia bacterium]